jgi:transposase-like protein
MCISCKSCGSTHYHLAGKMNCKQRYRCKDCGRHYTLEDRREKYTDAQRLQAVLLFRKGLSLRSIAEIIGTNNVTVLQWIRSIGARLKASVLAQPIEDIETLDVIEIDEMWHYTQKNSENYGFGLLTLVPRNASLPAKLVLVAPKH